MANVRWIAIELILLDDEHKIIYMDFFANTFDCNADVYVVGFLAFIMHKKNNVKLSNKQNYLREVNAKHLHSPTNSLNEPILDPRGLYTDEQHSFTRRYA